MSREKCQRDRDEPSGGQGSVCRPEETVSRGVEKKIEELPWGTIRRQGIQKKTHVEIVQANLISVSGTWEEQPRTEFKEYGERGGGERRQTERGEVHSSSARGHQCQTNLS